MVAFYWNENRKLASRTQANEIVTEKGVAEVNGEEGEFKVKNQL